MNYDTLLSERIKDVKPSGIRRFFDILEEMKDAISLGIGEPDFVTPWHIRDAGIYSLEKGFTKYTGNAGMAELRTLTQVIILSDTFEQFAKPLMKKLDWPTIFCNTLEVAGDGSITGFRMRCPQSKLTTVRALQSIGYETIASGDSYNDLGMIQASKAGFLFKSTDKIKADHPELPAYETFDELLAAIKAAMD